MNKLINYHEKFTRVRYSEDGRNSNSRVLAQIEEFISCEDLHMKNYVPVADMSNDPIYRIIQSISDKINTIVIKIMETSEDLVIKDLESRRTLDPENTTNRRISSRERKIKDLKKSYISGRQIDLPDLISTYSARRDRTYNETLSIVWELAGLSEIIGLTTFRDIFSEKDEYLETSNTPFNGCIVGGYTRNILLGIQDKSTDIDISFGESSTMWKNVFNTFCERNTSRRSSSSYEYKIKPALIDFSGVRLTEEEKEYIIGNKIHCMHKCSTPLSYLLKRTNTNIEELNSALEGEIDLKGYVQKNYALLDPAIFDFTINCACLSLTNGMLYATPVTLHDLQNKIVRACSDVYRNGQMPNEGLLIRALRFAHKYNMSIDARTYKIFCASVKTIMDLDSSNVFDIHTAVKGVLHDEEGIKKAVYKNMQEVGIYVTNKFENIDSYFEFLKLILPKYKEAEAEFRLVSGLLRGSRGDDY